MVVSKNPGGSKRVTSLADALKLNFGIITTDRRRSPPMHGSSLLDSGVICGRALGGPNEMEPETISLTEQPEEAKSATRSSPRIQGQVNGVTHSATQSQRQTINSIGASPLSVSTRIESASPPTSLTRSRRSVTAPPTPHSHPDIDDSADEFTDERAREVITGRLIQGHIVDDNFPSPSLSTMSGSVATLPGDPMGPSQFDDRDPMTSSYMSELSSFQPNHAIGGTFDASLSDEDEEGLRNPELEHTVTLVGNVNERTVFIIDDMIDGSSSWVAAAETVVKRGGAKKVYCIATHGLFGEDCLEVMENCQCINYIVVANTFPIDPEKIKVTKKLVVLDLSGLLAEAIRRNHYGESISQLYQYYYD